MPWELKNDRPIYLQLMEQINYRIVSGQYASGSKLPSVRELAAEASVNPNTMQRAFSELERDGLVYTMRTSGRFITEDITMIQGLKEQMAINAIAEFLSNMERLGFNKEDAISLLNETVKEGTSCAQ